MKGSFIWSKIYQVVHHSVNMGVVESRLATFLKKRNFSEYFEQLMDRADLQKRNMSKFFKGIRDQSEFCGAIQHFF